MKLPVTMEIAPMARIATRLGDGRLRNRGSISGTGKMSVSYPKWPDRPWGTPRFLESKYWGDCGCKSAGVRSWPLTSIFKANEKQVLLIHDAKNCKWNLLRHLLQDRVDVDVVEELHSSSRLEVSDVLECGAASLGDCYPMFGDIAVVWFSGVKRHTSCTFRPLKTSQDVSKRRGPIIWHGITTQKSGDLNCRIVTTWRPSTSDIYKLRNV
jgi:hypothetical protein